MFSRTPKSKAVLERVCSDVLGLGLGLEAQVLVNNAVYRYYYMNALILHKVYARRVN